MGALCGKESPSSAPVGRVLGSAPSSSLPGATSRIPSSSKNPRKPKVGGPARTLAGASESSDAVEDPRAAAARAAEARNARHNSGKLASKLEDQKRKTNNQHLAELSKTNQQHKQQEQQQERLVWD